MPFVRTRCASGEGASTALNSTYANSGTVLNDSTFSIGYSCSVSAGYSNQCGVETTLPHEVIDAWSDHGGPLSGQLLRLPISTTNSGYNAASDLNFEVYGGITNGTYSTWSTYGDLRHAAWADRTASSVTVTESPAWVSGFVIEIDVTDIQQELWDEGSLRYNGIARFWFFGYPSGRGTIYNSGTYNESFTTSKSAGNYGLTINTTASPSSLHLLARYGGPTL